MPLRRAHADRANRRRDHRFPPRSRKDDGTSMVPAAQRSPFAYQAKRACRRLCCRPHEHDPRPSCVSDRFMIVVPGELRRDRLLDNLHEAASQRDVEVMRGFPMCGPTDENCRILGSSHGCGSETSMRRAPTGGRQADWVAMLASVHTYPHLSRAKNGRARWAARPPDASREAPAWSAGSGRRRVQGHLPWLDVATRTLLALKRAEQAPRRQRPRQTKQDGLPCAFRPEPLHRRGP